MPTAVLNYDRERDGAPPAAPTPVPNPPRPAAQVGEQAVETPVPPSPSSADGFSSRSAASVRDATTP
eukprot:10790923-Alexandrium_andersonii.AAC.1